MITEAINRAVEALEERVLRYCDGAIERHRKAMWVRERWCCTQMVRFARDVWNMPNPPQEVSWVGSVNLQLRGENINYCPFCGVFVGKRDA